MDTDIYRIAKKRDRTGLDIHITRQVTRSAVETSQEITALYDIISGVAGLADIRISAAHRYASSSLGDTTQRKPMIGSMGPVGVDHRTPNEHIHRDSLIDRALLLALAVNKISELRGSERD